MPNLLENKQLIHIATEVVALIALIFYFSSKNKKLMQYIEDLSQRLEDQEDLIQKHEQIIRQLVQAVNAQNGNQPQPSRSQPSGSQPSRSQPSGSQPKKSKKSKMSNLSSSTSRDQIEILTPPTVHFDDNNNEIVEDIQHVKPVVELVKSSDDDSDSDLDNEIAEELQELQSQQEEGLKKNN